MTLRFWNFVCRQKKSGQISKKNFFSELFTKFRNTEQFLNAIFDYDNILHFHWLIAQSKEEKFFFQKHKKSGRGERKWFEFHFENIDRFFNLKSHGISWVLWIITIFSRTFVVNPRNLHKMSEKFPKKFRVGSNFPKS